MIKFHLKIYIAIFLFCSYTIAPQVFNLQATNLYAENASIANTDEKLQLLISPKILILNSDVTLSKYSTAQESFKSIMGNNCKELDIGSKWKNLKNIKNSISDDDIDIIYCIGSKALQLAQQFAKKSSIIFSLTINWQRFRLGKNTYGISNELNPTVQLFTYKYIFPDIKNIGVIYNKTYSKEWVKLAKEIGEKLDINIITKSIKNPKYISDHLEKLLPKVDAFWLIPDPIVLEDKKAIDKIFSFCDQLNKPIFAYNELFVEQGATIAISPDIPTIGRQAAAFAKSLSLNEKINKEVLEPAGSSIVLNLKQVEKCGININMDALDSVNKIIE